MNRIISCVILAVALLAGPAAKAQECFFLKNVLDTLYQIDPSTGSLASAALSTDFPGQGYFGYLSTIDPIGRNYMFITRLSDSSFDDFGLKIYDLDSQVFVTSVLLTGYEAASPGVGQFSFHGMEYGAIANEVYMAPVAGDSLYKIDLQTGAVTAQQEIPGFANTYSYLHTFYQTEQRYAMIATDASGQRRFFQVDIDDDTTYVSPPMSFPEPLRALEVSDLTGDYYVISDVDQMVYLVDPIAGTLTSQFSILGYVSAYGYLHTFDYATDTYLMVGIDTLQGISLFSISPGTGSVNQVPFPVPAAAYFGLEATNTQYLAKLINDLSTSVPKNFEGLEMDVFPNPTADWIQLEWDIREPLSMSLLDLSGKMVYQKVGIRGTSARIPVGELASGRYLLQVQAAESGRRYATWVVVE